jgi:hypothetical protein
LPRSNIGKPWLVQLAIGEKWKTNEMVKEFPMETNGLHTKADLNVIPLASYDFLIIMDWLNEFHVVFDCYNKEITFLNK